MIKVSYCRKCNGAVFHYRELDWEGNVVLSTRCWNGHFMSLSIENFMEQEKKDKIEYVGAKNDILAYMGLYSKGKAVFS